MTPEEIQALITESACFYCQIPAGLVNYVILLELDLLSKDQPIPDDPRELIAQAGCLSCMAPIGLVPYLIMVKLQELE